MKAMEERGRVVVIMTTNQANILRVRLEESTTNELTPTFARLRDALRDARVASGGEGNG